MAESNSNAELNVNSHSDNVDFSNLESKEDYTESLINYNINVGILSARVENNGW